MSMLPADAHRILERPVIFPKGSLPPKASRKSPTIIPPAEGWQPFSIYLVEVSWSEGNPIHEAILHTGFLEKGTPQGPHSQVWLNKYDAPHSFGAAYYLRVVKTLHTKV